MALFGLTRSSEPARRCRAFAAGEPVFSAGSGGLAWRVRQGVIRLDRQGEHGEAAFASLAVAGDIVGCESMLFGVYAFSACALSGGELEPWPEGDGAPTGSALLASLAQAQSRAVALLALRGGQAANRILGLIRLLANGEKQVVLPSRQDIADITDLRFETVSRIIKSLERAHCLVPQRIAGVHATRSYSIDLQQLGTLS